MPVQLLLHEELDWVKASFLVNRQLPPIPPNKTNVGPTTIRSGAEPLESG